jgi:ElaB/YqjD/DUF883 family membrane-anchored ribosome-binding protein
MTRPMPHSRTIESDAEKLKHTASQLGADMQRVGEALKTLAEDSWEGVQEKLTRLYEEGKDRYGAAESRLEASVRSDPLRAVLIAAGVGFVLAYIRRK